MDTPLTQGVCTFSSVSIEICLFSAFPSVPTPDHQSHHKHHVWTSNTQCDCEGLGHHGAIPLLVIIWEIALWTYNSLPYKLKPHKHDSQQHITKVTGYSLYGPRLSQTHNLEVVVVLPQFHIYLDGFYTFQGIYTMKYNHAYSLRTIRVTSSRLKPPLFPAVQPYFPLSAMCTSSTNNVPFSRTWNLWHMCMELWLTLSHIMTDSPVLYLASSAWRFSLSKQMLG